jgi:hypothetical protein
MGPAAYVCDDGKKTMERRADSVPGREGQFVALVFVEKGTVRTPQRQRPRQARKLADDPSLQTRHTIRACKRAKRASERVGARADGSAQAGWHLATRSYS